MAAVTPQSIAPTGLVTAYAAVGSSDVISGAGVNAQERLFLHVKNGGGSSCTVTIPAVSPTGVKVAGVGSLTVPTLTATVAASADQMIGPIPAAYISATGTVTVNYSATASVTAAVFYLPQQSY